jgi:hypothetical protein
MNESREKRGAYEAEIQQCIAKIFREITPFVYSEARAGFADLVVYVNDENLTTWATKRFNEPKTTAESTCRDVDRDSASSRDMTKEQEPERQPTATRHVIQNDGIDMDMAIPKAHKNLRREVASSHVPSKESKKTEGTRRETCQRITTRKWKLEKGLHLLEIKSNHDNINRFGCQLPHYCLFGDYVWLVVEDKKIPRWLPPFVGVLQYMGSTLTIKRDAMKIDRTPPLSEQAIKIINPEIAAISHCKKFIGFLRAWFINSVFHSATGGNNIIDMPCVDDLIKLKKTMNSPRLHRHPNIKTLNEFLKEL